MDCWLIDSLSEWLTGNTPADVLRASTSRAPWLRLEGGGGLHEEPKERLRGRLQLTD